MHTGGGNRLGLPLGEGPFRPSRHFPEVNVVTGWGTRGPTVYNPSPQIAGPTPKSKTNKSPPSKDSGSKETNKKKVTFRWMKGELLGRGSQGSVYMAFNATTGEVIAVKQVEIPQTASDKRRDERNKFIEALIDERDTLRDLDHPNIVQYLGFEENPATLNIFLQYVSGGTIGTCLKQYGPFSDGVTRHFAFQILEGLKYIHSKGIMHRDLKPDNVLVEESGICKISDFGISKKLERAHTMMRGTSFYMAPEIIQTESGRNSYDSKVDIWSMGCITMEMWTAKRPWEGVNNPLTIFIKLLEKLAPPLPDDFEPTKEGKEYLDACFTSDPKDRPSADVLQTFPCLQLPKDWSFPGMEDMGVKRTRSGRESHIDDGRYYAPTRGAETIVPNVKTSLPRPITPPLVFIDPPAPRKQPSRWPRERSSSIASESSDSQPSSQSGSRPAKKLVIYNPDDPTEKRPAIKRPRTPPPAPFVYNPPPLPETRNEAQNQPVQYSARLGPLHPNRFVDPLPKPPIDHPPPPKSSGLVKALLSPLSRRSRSNGPATSSPISPSTETMLSDTGSDFSTSSIWQKPPTRPSAEPSASSSNQISRHASLDNITLRPMNGAHDAQQISPVVGDTRPAISEVLGRFEAFFPGHDLEQRVVERPVDSRANIQVDKVEPNRTGVKMRSVKSIIAEEQGGSRTRPRTQLWDSRIEEIPRPPR